MMDRQWRIEMWSPLEIKHKAFAHLSIKEGSLFCIVLFCTEQDGSIHVLGVFGKLLMRRGACAWFHDIWTCGAKVLEDGKISSLKIK
jgi:hypothetical protein